MATVSSSSTLLGNNTCSFPKSNSFEAQKRPPGGSSCPTSDKIYKCTISNDGGLEDSENQNGGLRVSTSSLLECYRLCTNNLRPELIAAVVLFLLSVGLGVAIVWCLALHRKTNSIGREIERLQMEMDVMRLTQSYCNCKSNAASAGTEEDSLADAEADGEDRDDAGDGDYQNLSDAFPGNSNKTKEKKASGDESRGRGTHPLTRHSENKRNLERLKRNSDGIPNKKTAPQYSKNKRGPNSEKKKTTDKARKKSEGFRLEGKDLEIQEGGDAVVGWQMANWSTAGFGQYSAVTGRFLVREKGLYLIYSQIVYLTASPSDGYFIMVNDQIISKCFVSVDYINDKQSFDANARYKTCHVTTVQPLEKNQNVWLQNLDMENRLFHNPDKTSNFWGMVRLSD